MERDVGGGIGVGYTYKPTADSFQCMTKPTTIKKNKLKKKMFVFDVIQKPKTVRITSPGEIIKYYYNCVVNYEAA